MTPTHEEQSAEYRLSLRIWHPRYLPDEISRELEVQPTISRPANAPRQSIDGKELPPLGETFWTVPFTGNAADSLSEAIFGVCAWLNPHREFLSGIRSAGGRAEIFAGIFFSRNIGETLDVSILENLGRLRLDLALGLYAGDAPSVSASE